MSDENQIEQMRLIILKDKNDDSQDDLFEVYLENARAIQLNTLFPYDKEAEVEETDFRLRNWQVRCAIELYGATDRAGVQSYSENGLRVDYFEGFVSKSLLNELVARAGCPKEKVVEETTTETSEETSTEVTDETNGGGDGE